MMEGTLGRGWQLAVEYWPMVSMFLVSALGAYGVKIKLAVNSLQETVVEIEQTRTTTTKALTPDPDGVVRITEAEAADIARELQEDVVQIHKATKNVLALIPEKLKSRLPLEL